MLNDLIAEATIKGFGMNIGIAPGIAKPCTVAIYSLLKRKPAYACVHGQDLETCLRACLDQVAQRELVKIMKVPPPSINIEDLLSELKLEIDQELMLDPELLQPKTGEPECS